MDDFKNNGLIDLKLLRRKRNFNQQKVDMDFHIRREVISHYENGNEILIYKC